MVVFFWCIFELFAHLWTGMGCAVLADKCNDTVDTQTLIG